jgi:aspartate 1-decarboxylase
LIIIATYATLNEQELKNFQPKIVQVDAQNRHLLKAA